MDWKSRNEEGAGDKLGKWSGDPWMLEVFRLGMQGSVKQFLRGSISPARQLEIHAMEERHVA